MPEGLIQLAESFRSGDVSVFPGSSPAAHRRGLSEAVVREAAALAEMLQHWREGSHLAGYHISEAISTSDLASYAAGVIVDRIMVANYETAAKVWPLFCRQVTVNNFQKTYLSELDIAPAVMPTVPEQTPYPARGGAVVGESPIQVEKHGHLYGWSIEAAINDRLDQLMKVPDVFPQDAVETEDYAAMALIQDPDTGDLNADFFNVGNGNVGTLVLNQDNLETVYTSLTTKVDPVKGGIVNPGNLQLMVGPALALTAERIVNTQKVERTDGTVTYTENNPLSGKLSVVVNPKLQGQVWVVMPQPTSARRAPFYVATLRGWETPDFRKANNAGMTLQGGQLPAESGSFADDTVWYRARHICGAATHDALLTYGSDNSGS